MLQPFFTFTIAICGALSIMAFIFKGLFALYKYYRIVHSSNRWDYPNVINDKYDLKDILASIFDAVVILIVFFADGLHYCTGDHRRNIFGTAASAVINILQL